MTCPQINCPGPAREIRVEKFETEQNSIVRWDNVERGARNCKIVIEAASHLNGILAIHLEESEGAVVSLYAMPKNFKEKDYYHGLYPDPDHFHSEVG